MNTATKTERAKIVAGGMGGFLNPPTHPEHTMSVQFDLRRRPENRGSMSLSAAAECQWIDAGTVSRARALLRDWERPSITSPEIVAWIHSVLGYFRSCYRNPAAGDRQWHASEMIIDSERNPMEHIDDCAGVNLIRKYYPEYMPTADDFLNAKWGR